MERVQEQTEMWVRSVQLPQETETYKPVSHADLIDVLESSLLERGLMAYQKKYITARNGQELHGDWILKRQDQTVEQLQRGDTAMGISFVNSYNKHLKLELVPGLRILVCGNGMMSKTAIATFDRKHTGDINLEFPIFIQNSLEKIDPMFEILNSNLSRLKEIQISERIMSELAGRLFIQENILSSEQMSMLKREIEKPSFSQFIVNNAYSFYQHVTYALKNSHPSEVIDKYTGVHDFITKEFSL